MTNREGPLLDAAEAATARAWVKTASRAEYEARKRSMIQAAADNETRRRNERELQAIQARFAPADSKEKLK